MCNAIYTYIYICLYIIYVCIYTAYRIHSDECLYINTHREICTQQHISNDATQQLQEQKKVKPFMAFLLIHSNTTD